MRISNDDIWMQGFCWLGKIFFELCLIFGAVSSAGLYDRVAKIVVYIAAALVQFPQHLKIQHLDDVCACSPAKCDGVDRFYQSYWDVSRRLGIELADPKDPDKAFGPRTEGIVLGIDYDSNNMTWHLREDKMARILILIREALEDREVTIRLAKSLVGKLINIRALVKGSKFHLSQLIQASVKDKDLDKTVKLGEWCCSDLYYFFLVLPVFSHRTQLEDPDRKADLHTALHCYSDAAGGSRESLGRGVGVVMVPLGIWSLVTWGRRINEGWAAYDGKSLAHKLSAWELAGPLLGLVISGNKVTGKQVVAWVDNDGSVAMYRKGWTTACDICNTLLVALYQVSTALDCDLYINNIMRCSNKEAEAADALSKMDMKRFRENMHGADLAPQEVPGALLAWLEDPLPDRMLGHKILTEMKDTDVKLLNY